MSGVFRDWYGEQLNSSHFRVRMEEVGRKLYGPLWRIEGATPDQLAEIERLVCYETEDEFVVPL